MVVKPERRSCRFGRVGRRFLFFLRSSAFGAFDSSCEPELERRGEPKPKEEAEIDVTVALEAPLRAPNEIFPVPALSGVQESEEAPTEPASPSGGAGTAYPAIEFSWAPANAPNLGAGILPAGQEDPLNTSSRTYGRPQPRPAPARQGPEHASQMAMRQELELSLQKVQQQQYSDHMQQQQPFPKAKGAVRQSRLEEVAAEVAGLTPQVLAVVSKETVAAEATAHPKELEGVLEKAQDILHRSRLTESDLESLGWPSRELKLIRDLVNRLQKWQSCEAAAKQALGSSREPLLTDVVTVLEQTFTAWRTLSDMAQKTTGGSLSSSGPREELRVCADLGMRSRASTGTPLVSALLDKALNRARVEPDLVAVRRLEALLSWQVELQHRSAAFELGVLPFLEQMLKELSECLQGTARLEKSLSASAGGSMLSAPEVLWRAIVHGDVASVESIIRQGGLVSGRTQDPHGHSVLWNAIAFERSEVALLLLRYFPPDMLHGVSLGELHARNGNSLLHLVSGFQRFDSQCEGLFAMLFERMPEVLRIHRNLRGQSFLHIAAGRRNFWILNYAAARGLAFQFSVADSGGLTPRLLLGQHLALLQLQPPTLATGDTLMPSWCSFSALQPPSVGSKPPFADCALRCQEGALDLYAHRVILAAASSKWHDQLRVRPPGSNGDLQVLKLAECSLEVAAFAVQYLYTGDTACTSLDAPKLLELLRFCRRELLPASLGAWAAHELIQKLPPGLVPTLLLEGRSLGLGAPARRFLAYHFICDEAAWQAAADAEVRKAENGEDVRGAILGAALSELEADAPHSFMG
ncbi:unnamed protein product [Effrenium voratum]|uniref:BTB domain-containing protein n=1 Tax=Effrenium voratum TaxID=2562239 RepID=A0AA36JI41_9DINO|nr:unnamed protein product [Effrenium voratum]